MGKDASRLRQEFQARLGQFARQLGQELYPDGLPEGTTFSDLEEIAEGVGDAVARHLIEDQVRARAQARAERHPGACPDCEGPLVQAPDRPRRMTTTRGQVTWTEVRARCPRCRRAFSPSRPGAGA